MALESRPVEDREIKIAMLHARWDQLRLAPMMCIDTCKLAPLGALASRPGSDREVG